MKKIIILRHGGGELANQLWNFAGIYAYCLEKGFACRNYSFFEYGNYFDTPIDNKIIDMLFFRPFRGYKKRRNSLRTRVWRLFYGLYSKVVMLIFRKQVISSENTAKEKYFLPPTSGNSTLSEAERRYDTLYFTGWLFRNPVGMVKFRDKIVSYLRPKDMYIAKAKARMTDAGKIYRHVIGVHMRLTDYRTHKSGEYFVPPERVREILAEYLDHSGKSVADTLFIIASDEPVPKEIFHGLNIMASEGNAVTDLYLLSLCDAVIGSNSSFGDFAAYCGNKPHIIFQNKPMDWDYYKDKNVYFMDNKYSVMADL